jgi:hypothetical protein
VLRDPLGLDYLVGSLLSSKSAWDLQKLNPYFDDSKKEHVYDIIAAAILHANRIGQINRCLSDARGLLSLLHVTQNQAPQQAAEPNPALIAGLIQKVAYPCLFC